MEKRKYEKPTIEIVELDVEDIITTSSINYNPDGWDLTSGDHWYSN